MRRAVISTFVQQELQDERTGHDFYHGQRVAKLAEQMLLQDHPAATQANRDLAFAAGMVHDTIDEKVCAQPAAELARVTTMLQEAAATASQIADISFTITHMSFSKNIGQHYQLSLTGQYVQDADRLESLGAIGIARAFTFGGKHGNLIYEPAVKPQKLTSHHQYRAHQETTLNHFYEKLFHLAALMNTPAGKKAATERTKFMKKFVAQFLAEWQAE